MSEIYRCWVAIEAREGFPVRSFRMTIAPGVATVRVGRAIGRLFFGGLREITIDAHTHPNVSLLRRWHGGLKLCFHMSQAAVVIYPWGFKADRLTAALTQAGFVLRSDPN